MSGMLAAAMLTAKNLTYAAAKEKDGDSKNKHDRIRFEAKYSF